MSQQSRRDDIEKLLFRAVYDREVRKTFEKCKEFNDLLF